MRGLAIDANVSHFARRDSTALPKLVTLMAESHLKLWISGAVFAELHQGDMTAAFGDVAAFAEWLSSAESGKIENVTTPSRAHDGTTSAPETGGTEVRRQLRRWAGMAASRRPLVLLSGDAAMTLKYWAGRRRAPCTRPAMGPGGGASARTTSALRASCMRPNGRRPSRTAGPAGCCERVRARFCVRIEHVNGHRRGHRVWAILRSRDLLGTQRVKPSDLRMDDLSSAVRSEDGGVAGLGIDARSAVNVMKAEVVFGGHFDQRRSGPAE